VAFVFYDTETTGIKTSYDQILQFAAVRTDDQLNELEAFEIRSRLLPDVVPSPRAMLTNGITVQQLTDETLPSHYEMVQRIRQRLLAWSPAVFVGYNSIRFDEHLLRQAFYKTLNPLYLTNANGNLRSDAMRLIQASSVFAPDAITVPLAETGDRVTYRLDQVAPANDIDHEHAHEAMADVRATFHLCRRLLNRAPELWLSSVGFCRKPAILDFVVTAPFFCLTDFYGSRPYSCIVSTIGYNVENANEIYVYNLAVDPQGLAALGDSGLRSRLGQRPKPVRRMRANAVPILSPVENAPSFAEGLSLGSAELQRRENFLQANAGLRERLIAASGAIREIPEPSPHIEQQIYDGFFTNTDDDLMEYFHSIAWEERLDVVETFEESRLQEIGFRLIHCERPDLLDNATRRSHTDRIARNLLGLGGEVPWLTLREAIREANNLLEQAQGPELGFIREHRDYLQRRLADAMRSAL